MSKTFLICTGWWWLNHLENILVNGKDYPIYEMEKNNCLKPPTRLYQIALNKVGLQTGHCNPPLPCVQRYLESQGSKLVATNTNIVWRMGHRCWWRYADDSNWEIRQAPINKPKHLMYRTVTIPFLISLKLLRPELRYSLGCSRKGPTWQQSPIRDGKYWNHPHVGKTMP